MNLNSYKIMFLVVMMLGVMISLSSNNMFMIWLGMEISFMSFMPMMSVSSKLTSHSSMKYYLIQSISSLLMMLGLLFMLNNMMNSNLILMLSLTIKIALAPFCYWLISMVDSMNIYVMLLLITLLKLPLINLISLLKIKMDLLCIMSMITSSVCSINQTSIRKLIAYSSVFNMGLLIPSLFQNMMWMNYMILYSIIMYMLIKIMNKCNINFINQSLINEMKPAMKINLLLIMISLGGMPPLMGFSLKLMIVEKMIISNNIMLLLTVTICSVIMMFIYIRLSFLNIMFSSITNKWLILILNKNSNFMLTLNLMLIPTIMLMKMMI